MSNQVTMRELMKGVVPYVGVENADEVIAFYERALGAIVRGEPMRNDAGKIVNVSLQINGGCLMLMDVAAGMDGAVPRPFRADQGQFMMMQLVMENGQSFWDRAIQEGCTQMMPFEKQPWGDTYGQFVDPYGIEWSLLSPSAEHMEAAKAM